MRDWYRLFLIPEVWIGGFGVLIFVLRAFGAGARWFLRRRQQRKLKKIVDAAVWQ